MSSYFCACRFIDKTVSIVGDGTILGLISHITLLFGVFIE